MKRVVRDRERQKRFQKQLMVKFTSAKQTTIIDVDIPASDASRPLLAQPAEESKSAILF